ncbi:MAG TPA: hypothetical protein VJT72_16415 [Pseudonocardiaceae bacterium]|nr:hypothetical protein [Pseudonocardiaceae bacterium]
MRGDTAVDGQQLKTLPSRLTSIDLTRLRAQGARPAGPPPPARPSWTRTQRRRTRGDPAHRQCHRHGLHRREVGVGMPGRSPRHPRCLPPPTPRALSSL